MTHQDDYNPPEKVTDLLAKNGWGAIPELVRILVNQAMAEVRAHSLHAEEYPRTSERTGYANGYKPKTVKTRVGEITFSVLQVRDAAVLVATRITQTGNARC